MVGAKSRELDRGQEQDEAALWAMLSLLGFMKILKIHGRILIRE